MAWRLKSFLVVFFAVTSGALCVRLFLLEDCRILSSSMYPTLQEGDFVLASKFNFNVRFPFSTFEIVKLRRPQRSELVLFSVPDHGVDTYIKRVVALEGDRVAIQDGVLSINGVAARYLSQPESDELYQEVFPGQGTSYSVKWSRDRVDNYGPVDIPPGYFFALGDNRLDNNDSREWGPIPYACLKGKPKLVWFSMEADGSVRKSRVGLWVHS